MPSTIEFNRPKKYEIVKELGKGACGKTALIRDLDMRVDLVVKKYSPFFEEASDPAFHAELNSRFREEARILFNLNHPNVVRVFNFYDYMEFRTAYIIMEYIEGSNIEEYLKDHSLNFDSVFEKTISGFEHLASRKILHRDIRPQNLLVSEDGEPKIIDFGFGKQTSLTASNNEKSISLNWWCEPPPEFDQQIYDTQTEVYFVGKLFEKICSDNDITSAKHAETISRMCTMSRDDRFASFHEVYSELNKGLFERIEFSPAEITTYREFADQLTELFSEISPNAEHPRDASALIDDLEELHKSVMLEEYLPDTAKLCRLFIKSEFKYFRNASVEVELIERFSQLLRDLPRNKRDIVMANLNSRFDAIPRPKPRSVFDDEIPF